MERVMARFGFILTVKAAGPAAGFAVLSKTTKPTR